MWYFTRHIENKLDKTEIELKALVATQSARSDQLFLNLSEYRKDLSDYRKEADQKFYDLLMAKSK